MSRFTALPAVALVIFWSSGFVGATLVTREASFVTALAWRTTLSAIVLGAAAVLRGDRISAVELRQQVLVGLLVQAVYLGGVFAAAGAGVPAGTSALIAALQPLVVAALAGPVLAAPPTRRQVTGLLLGAAGVALVVAGDLGGSAPAAAFLLPVVAVGGLAAGTLLQARWQPRASLLTSLAVQSATGAVVFVVAAALTGRYVPPPTGAFWFAVAWVVVLASFGGYGSYLLVVRRSGPTIASTLLYLTPPTTALWAWAMFGQRPALLAVPGVLVCAVSAVLAAGGVKERPDAVGDCGSEDAEQQLPGTREHPVALGPPGGGRPGGEQRGDREHRGNPEPVRACEVGQ
jgi:drug/metabolite transporter (DMT)-like permease